LRLNAAYLVCLICLRHFQSEIINLLLGYGPHKVYEKVVVDAINRIISNLFESLLISIVYILNDSKSYISGIRQECQALVPSFDTSQGAEQHYIL
jgi:hypothetical protein